MMADALGRPITICTETEASCRGAALWGLESLAIIDDIGAIPASTGAVFTPRPEYQAAYHDLLSRQNQLYERLYG
jgi:sugar (pentulose or hexulose) kinase